MLGVGGRIVPNTVYKKLKLGVNRMKKSDFVTLIDTVGNKYLLKKEEVQSIWGATEPDDEGDKTFIQMKGDDEQYGVGMSFDQVVEELFKGE